MGESLPRPIDAAARSAHDHPDHFGSFLVIRCITPARVLWRGLFSEHIGPCGKNASEWEGRLDLSTRFADSADDLWQKTGGNDGMALFGQMDAIGLPMS